MTLVSYETFIQLLAQDFNIDLKLTKVLKLPSDPQRIKTFIKHKAHAIRIWDGMYEHPYMLGVNQRNAYTLRKGIELRYEYTKPFRQILKELPIRLENHPCIITTSGAAQQGREYIYKDYRIQFRLNSLIA